MIHCEQPNLDYFDVLSRCRNEPSLVQVVKL